MVRKEECSSRADFARSFDHLKKSGNYTNKTLAQELGVSDTVISYYRTGKHIPTFDTAGKMFSVIEKLDVSENEKRELRENLSVHFGNLIAEADQILLSILAFSSEKRTYVRRTDNPRSRPPVEPTDDNPYSKLVERLIRNVGSGARLSKILGVTRTAVSQYRRGTIKPRNEILNKMQELDTR